MTREKGGTRSVIDFMLVNEAMYRYFVKMMIDENKERLGVSDHVLLEAKFSVRGEYEEERVEEVKQREHYKVNDEDKLKVFAERVETKVREWQGEMKVENLDEIMRSSADEILKRVYKGKKIKGKEILQPKWMTREIRTEIKLRREYNRKKRRGDEETKRRYLDLYIKQKSKVKEMVYRKRSS